MKKLLLIIFSLTCFTITNANPLPSPPPIIGLSEIGYDSDGKWVIEVGYQNIYNQNTYMPVDSIFICSSTGRAKLKNPRFNSWAGIMMVRNDSLLTNLNINPSGDSIQIEYYVYNVKKLYVPLVFGNFKNATLACPQIGKSIASYFVFDNMNMYNSTPIYANVYSFDKSPTLGVENDSTGMCGTLKGKIYDQNNQLLINSWHGLSIHGLFNFQPSSDGSYSVKAFSFKNRISKMYYSDDKSFIVDILPIEFNMMPDSVISVDIHILKVTAVNEIKSDPVSVLQVSPNPIKDLSFNYKTSIPVKSSVSYIELINLNGQKIARFPITENDGKIKLPTNTINGIYTLRLFVNNKNYGTSKIIIIGK